MRISALPTSFLFFYFYKSAALPIELDQYFLERLLPEKCQCFLKEGNYMRKSVASGFPKVRIGALNIRKRVLLKTVVKFKWPAHILCCRT